MDLSDLDPSPRDLRAGDERTPAAPGLALVGQMGAELSQPLEAAVARIDAVLASGRLDRAGLNTLRADIELARDIAETGRQIERCASLAMAASPEPIELGPVLRKAVLRRAGKAEARGIEVRQIIRPAHVMIDPALLLELLQAVLDWSVARARSGIEFRLEMKSWPAHALLSCRFVHHPVDQAKELPPGAVGAFVARSLDTMAWRLVLAWASALGLIAERDDTPVRTSMTLEFPRTVDERVIDTVASPLQTAPDTGPETPVAGQVLVLATRREMRNQVRASLRQMNLAVNYAADLEEASRLSAETQPQAVVYEAAFADECAFAIWRDELLARAPDTGFIEVSDQGRALEIVTINGLQVARVGRDAMVRSLPSALSFELARQAER